MISKSLITLMMEAVRTSKTLVHFNVTTQRYIPEDSKLPSGDSLWKGVNKKEMGTLPVVILWILVNKSM
jgi:hypothetical protein